jgi:hypothetical protein
MPLSATVYCDCFERGRLRSTPPPGCTFSVDEWGDLRCDSDDTATRRAFNRWRFDQACEHRHGFLVHHLIGNIAGVAAIRAELERFADRFPMLLAQVVYNGTHCCDFIPAAEVPRLRAEIEALAEVRCADPGKEDLIQEFAAQMGELMAASQAVGKPIVF